MWNFMTLFRCMAKKAASSKATRPEAHQWPPKASSELWGTNHAEANGALELMASNFLH